MGQWKQRRPLSRAWPHTQTLLMRKSDSKPIQDPAPFISHWSLWEMRYFTNWQMWQIRPGPPRTTRRSNELIRWSGAKWDKFGIKRRDFKRVPSFFSFLKTARTLTLMDEWAIWKGISKCSHLSDLHQNVGHFYLKVRFITPKHRASSSKVTLTSWRAAITLHGLHFLFNNL